MAVKISKSSNGDNQVPNLIANGTNIVGDIISDGDFRIEGTVKGKINTKGRIVVGNSGVVVGDIVCNNADICGKVDGKLEVIDLTILKSTSSFIGDVTTNKISIEPGAVFSGTCTMLDNKKAK